MKKRVWICILILIFCLLSFDMAFLQSWIVPMVVFGLGFGICLVWLAKLMELGESWSYRKIRKHNKKLSKVDDEFKKIWEAINGKVDKKVDISNVRPGSRPSIAYQNMVIAKGEGEARDSGQKD